MESGEKTHQELEKIEQQIARLQAAAGPDENTQREIQQLHDRIQALRKDMSSSHYKAWDKDGAGAASPASLSARLY